MLPLQIVLTGLLTADSAADSLRVVGDAMEGLGLGCVRAWRVGERTVEAPEGLSFAEAAARIGAGEKSASFQLTKVSRAYVTEDVPGRYKFWFVLARSDQIFGDSLTQQRALLTIGRRLFATGRLLSASLERKGGGVACVPAPPIASYDRQLVLTTDADVCEAYDRPEAFWHAGWTVDVRGEQKLLTRCVDVVDGAELLRAIRDPQWEMARGARPKRTEYTAPDVEPDERTIFEAGDARLEPVGYAPSKQLVEYSCVLGSGQHIQGWEIFHLRSIVRKKKLPDEGLPVSTVRVVFMKRADAEGEKRPLLDVGVKVFYMGESGELVEITG